MANELAVDEVRETLSTIVKLLAAQVGPELPIKQRAPLLDDLRQLLGPSLERLLLLLERGA